MKPIELENEMLKLDPPTRARLAEVLLRSLYDLSEDGRSWDDPPPSRRPPGAPGDQGTRGSLGSLEALKGDRAGQHSIRINDQFRVCFTWTPVGPEDVEIVDYH
jgi:hypothetical protein